MLGELQSCLDCGLLVITGYYFLVLEDLSVFSGICERDVSALTNALCLLVPSALTIASVIVLHHPFGP